MVESHRLGTHVLTVSTKGLGSHLRRGHRNGVHLRSGRDGMGGGQGRATTGLVRRVGEGRERTTLTGAAVELRTHVRTSARLVGRAEVGAWRVVHLTLVAGLRVATATATATTTTTTTLITASTRTSRSISHMVAHIAMSRLRGFTTKVSRLSSARTKGSLWRRTDLQRAESTNN